MKAVLVALLALFPLTQARADFIPGRTRASAVAKLQVNAADGIYRGATEATVTEYRTDGKGVTRYDLTVNGRTEHFDVQEVNEESCGDRYVTRAKDEAKGRGELRLFHFLENLCKARDGEQPWTVEVQNHDSGRGQISKLELSGNPEYFLLSQSE